MVTYEIAPKAFTSPRGPESGTFDSLKARLQYLQELGITAVWLTGHSLADPHHFCNIWMQYAIIDPDKIEPTLGTPAQLRALIDEAHWHGIKVLLDVVTHGLMDSSPIVRSHPEWVRGETWGMRDYDWYGGHTDLDDWFRRWTNYVAQYGVDGFRLDVEMYRPGLWARVRKNAAAVGHPIILFEENYSAIPGITDFTEGEVALGSSSGNELLRDVPGFMCASSGSEGSIMLQLTT